MKQQNINKQAIRKQSPPSKAKTITKPDLSKDKNKIYLFYGSMLLLFLLSIVTFSPMLNNGFIETWDDGIYVIQNNILHDLSWKGIINIFTYGDKFQMLINNYHPITTFSLALNYKISGLSPTSYHLTNLIFHGLNAMLVFLFVYLLSNRKIWPAIIAGLLFAVHPMHVESVAWVSERKDVLYTFFFLAGLIVYLKYLEDKKVWKLCFTILLFILSCLSKAMAVPFPIILLLIDYYQKRKFTWKTLVEKIPFFAIALLIGFMSFHLQSTSAINKFETFTLYQRIMHASYGFIAYIIKFINPSNLSAFYPYPSITDTGLLPVSFRIAPFICAVIAIILIWLSTRKAEINRIIVFGILFYFFTIAMVLQFLSVGKAIMADRYSYIPYIGLSFIIGMLIDFYINKKSSMKNIAYVLISASLILTIVFSFNTYERTKLWKNDIILWSNAIHQYPDSRLSFIYEKRARKYMEKDQYEAALADYKSITVFEPANDNAFERIGSIYGQHLNDIDKAIENLEKAYKVNPKNSSVLTNLGVGFGIKGNFQRSLDYFLKAYEINKNDTVLLRNISAGYNNLGMKEKAHEFDQLARTVNNK
ncbi:MAG: hypothetical protein NTZ33_01660 [Bacteroidetes bacterium]|nr:hypothetical protein [Bacteroidota bacterium]